MCLLSPQSILKFLLGIIRALCSKIMPAEALRFLFELDNALYRLEGEYAVAYGSGVHPKHRLIRYHDFFIQRIGNGEHVLDIGCGRGELARDIAERSGAFVTGIDLNEVNISEAHERHAHERVRYIVGDALRDMPAEYYDVVVLSNVLEHIIDRQLLLTTIVERVSPRTILLRVPLFEREWRVPLKKELGIDWRELETLRDLQMGLVAALKTLGITLVRAEGLPGAGDRDGHYAHRTDGFTAT